MESSDSWIEYAAVVEYAATVAVITATAYSIQLLLLSNFVVVIKFEVPSSIDQKMPP
jgi:hypothetical protein